MPVNAGHAQVEQGGVVRAPLQGSQRGGPVGADGDLVAEPRQFHLHQVAEMGLVVGEQDPQSSLTRLIHVTGPP